jgi:hypothetical protein
MPCYDDGGERYLQVRCDELTRMLCWLCGTLSGSNATADIIGTNENLATWWKDHQSSDTSRVIREMNGEVGRFKNAQALAQHFVKMAEKVHPVSNFHKKWFKELANKVYEEHNERRQLVEVALKKLTAKEKDALGLK